MRIAALAAAARVHTGHWDLTPQRLADYARQLVPALTGSTAPAHMHLKIKGDLMPLTVDSANAVAVLSFTDDHGDAVPPPDGATAVASSSDTSILNVGDATAASDANGVGTLQFPLTEVAEGTAQLSVHATASDGSPLLGPDGATPISDPAPVSVTVNPGAAADEVFTVPGN
jgi:hypothetical protein